MQKYVKTFENYLYEKNNEEIKDWSQFDEIRILAGFGYNWGHSAGELCITDKSINNADDAKKAYKEFVQDNKLLKSFGLKKVKLSIKGWKRGSLPVILSNNIISL